jgi:outer membrane protein assembly factor BamB
MMRSPHSLLSTLQRLNSVRLSPNCAAQLLTFALLAIFLICVFPSTATGQQNAPSPQVYELPTVGPPTTFVNLQGVHFDPLTAIDIYFDSAQLASTTTDKNGSFGNGIISATGPTFTRLQVPSTALPGQHTITAKERVGQLSAQQSFLVRTDWAKYHFDLSNTGLNPYENVLSPDTVGNLALDWKYTTQGINLSSPAVVNGVVYVGSQDHNVYALNASTGTLIWKYLTGDEVDASPTVADGIVYVVSAGVQNQLFALNANTGALLWKYTAAFITSPPTVANGVVYVGAANNPSVYALNATTGARIWRFGTGGGSIDQSPAVANGVVYFSYGGGVYGLNAATGAPIWKYTTEAQIESAPVVANGVVYVGVTYQGNPNAPPGLYALNASTGALLWTVYVDGVMAGDGCGSATVANGLAYIGCYSFYEGLALYAIDVATQQFVWQGGFEGETPVVANGVAYVGSYALNASTGAVLWNWPEGFYPPVVVNGMVYAGSGDDIDAFGLPNQQMSEEFSPPERPDPARLTPNWGLQPNSRVTPPLKK